MKQIIAIGGGGFGRNPQQHLIEQYILDQAKSDKPNEDDFYILHTNLIKYLKKIYQI